jgi:hypothetical protein
MTFSALQIWQSDRLDRLDRLLAAHPDAAGSTTDPSVTREWTRALVLLLAGEFQGFCRDLHDEAANAIGRGAAGNDERLFDRVVLGLTINRGLDRRSADLQTLNSDFRLLGTKLSRALWERHPDQAARWLDGLEYLHRARNGVIHDDDSSVKDAAKAGWVLHIGTARRWRKLLDEVAAAMAQLADAAIADLLSKNPRPKGDCDDH